MNTEEPIEDIEDMETNEEYRIWKKNVPYLYDTVIIKALVWPSLTVQWLPVVNTPADADYATHKIIMGTHTSENEQNYLIIAKVHLPTPKSTQETSLHFDHKRVEIEAKICHDGEVNKARYCPQDPQLIATKTVVGEVHIFNCQNQLSKLPEGKANPDLKLLGHSKEGFGLSWNSNQKGTLLSSADDHLICMWDINSNQASNSMEPLVKYDYHKNVVGDVCWHKKQPAIFGSVDDDKKVMIWDTRKENKIPAFEIDAHKAEIFCIDFNPLNEFLFATGSSDKTACVWDLRKLSQPLATLSFHQDDITSVSWSPFDCNVLATGSHDKRIAIWDISKIGKPSKDEEGPPELVFLHGGHTSKVSDIAWNPNEKLTIGSVAEDNILHIWKIGDDIFA